MLLRAFFLLLIFLAPLSGTNVYAEDEVVENPTISNIIIQGIKRVTNNTILSYSNVEQGDRFSPELVKQIIKDLYETKYFDDISVSLNFNDLIINVSEKPIISKIVITDNNIIEDEDILQALEDVGITKTRPYDKNIFDKIEQELIRLYFDRGRYGAAITSKVVKLERNRVTVELVVNEGEASAMSPDVPFENIS